MGKSILGVAGYIRNCTASEPRPSHIGIALSEDDVLSSWIGPDSFEVAGSAKSAGGVDVTADSSHPSPAQVDELVTEWLDIHEVRKGSVVLVGWKLSELNRSQLFGVLPGFAEYLHPHAIELPSLTHALDGAKTYLGSRRDYNSWEKMAKTVASYEMLNLTGQPWRASHPGDDALMALLSWKWLQSVVAMPATEVALSMSGGVGVAGSFDM